MAYKFRRGSAGLSGSMTTDDIAYFFDTDTKIDWDQDYISLVTAGNNVLVVSGSAVGIGTASPSSRMHVYGNVSSNYLTLIDNDASSNAHSLKVTTDGNGAGTYVLDLESQSTTLFRVRGDGRVGIGKVTSLPSACLTVSGSTHGDADIAIASKLQHIGDSDTYISFEDDEIILYAGGRGFIKCQEDSTDKLMLNYGGLDIDLQVKGENDANLIRTNAASDLVGIGCTPEFKLHVSGAHNAIAATFVGEVFITGSSSKLVVEETDGSDYRVVIDPNNGPLIQFGNDTANNAYMTIGAFSSLNNIDTETRDFHLFGTNTTTGFYFDESLGKFGFGTSTPSSTLAVTGSFAKSIVTITGTSNNIGATHATILMDASSGNCAAQLPAVAGTEGRIYTFKRIDSSGNACKIMTNGSETVDGDSSDNTIDTQYNVLSIQSTGTQWFLIGEVHFGDNGD